MNKKKYYTLASLVVMPSICVYSILLLNPKYERLDYIAEKVSVTGNIGLGDGSDEVHYENFHESRKLSTLEKGMIFYMLRSTPVKKIKFWDYFKERKPLLVIGNNRINLDFTTSDGTSHKLLIVSWPYAETLLILDDKNRYYVKADLVTYIEQILMMKKD